MLTRSASHRNLWPLTLAFLFTALCQGATPLPPVSSLEDLSYSRRVWQSRDGLPEDRVRPLGRLEDADLAVVLDRATLFVFPRLAEGFGLPIVEAFKFGLPVIHSDDPALVEVAAGAGLVVERPASPDDDDAYTDRLAEAIGRVLTDGELAGRLSILASDRARAFSWRDSAERVWQLHADL